MTVYVTTYMSYMTFIREHVLNKLIFKNTNSQTKIGIIIITQLFSHLNYTHHATGTLYNYYYWEIVLPNGLFERLLPFSITFYLKA